MTSVEDSPSYKWALRCVVVLLIGGVGGATTFFAEDGLGFTISEPLLVAIVAVLVFAALYSLARVYRALADDPTFSRDDRERYRRRILVAGPVAALEIILNHKKYKA